MKTDVEFIHITNSSNIRNIMNHGLSSIDLSDKDRLRRPDAEIYSGNPVYLTKPDTWISDNKINGIGADRVGILAVDTSDMALLADFPTLGNYGVSIRSVAGSIYAYLESRLAFDKLHDLFDDDEKLQGEALLDPNSEFTRRAIELTGSCAVEGSIASNKIAVVVSHGKEMSATVGERVGLLATSPLTDQVKQQVQKHQEYQRDGFPWHSMYPEPRYDYDDQNRHDFSSDENPSAVKFLYKQDVADAEAEFFDFCKEMKPRADQIINLMDVAAQQSNENIVPDLITRADNFFRSYLAHKDHILDVLQYKLHADPMDDHADRFKEPDFVHELTDSKQRLLDSCIENYDLENGELPPYPADGWRTLIE